MAGHRSDDPTLNDDSQPSVTSPDQVLKDANLAAGVPLAAVVIQPPADAVDLEVRKARADIAVEDVVSKEGEVTVEAETTGEDFGTGNYEDRTVAQLQALAASKGLSTSGTKADLIDRLRA